LSTLCHYEATGLGVHMYVINYANTNKAEVSMILTSTNSENKSIVTTVRYINSTWCIHTYHDHQKSTIYRCKDILQEHSA